MVLKLPVPTTQPRVLMQSIGYFEFHDPNTGEMSYVRRLATNFYPRFHVYIELTPDHLRLNLHLDQKKPSYAGFTKHNGEYDGPTIDKEADRIYGLLAK